PAPLSQAGSPQPTLSVPGTSAQTSRLRAYGTDSEKGVSSVGLGRTATHVVHEPLLLLVASPWGDPLDHRGWLEPLLHRSRPERLRPEVADAGGAGATRGDDERVDDGVVLRPEPEGGRGGLPRRLPQRDRHAFVVHLERRQLLWLGDAGQGGRR